MRFCLSEVNEPQDAHSRRPAASRHPVRSVIVRSFDAADLREVTIRRLTAGILWTMKTRPNDK